VRAVGAYAWFLAFAGGLILIPVVAGTLKEGFGSPESIVLPIGFSGYVLLSVAAGWTLRRVRRSGPRWLMVVVVWDVILSAAVNVVGKTPPTTRMLIQVGRIAVVASTVLYLLRGPPSQVFQAEYRARINSSSRIVAPTYWSLAAALIGMEIAIFIVTLVWLATKH
jgi:hypothetical protein